jgi:3-deoxy-manno-octulosonate cytidylyltransferase (CMP-KDO synthetase)
MPPISSTRTCVKVVLAASGDALYFSRAPIPYARDHFAREAGGETLPPEMLAYRHVGMYAYRARFLRTYAKPGAVTAGKPGGARTIACPVARLPHQRGDCRSPATAGVDTPEDARRLQEWFKKV